MHNRLPAPRQRTASAALASAMRARDAIPAPNHVANHAARHAPSDTTVIAAESRHIEATLQYSCISLTEGTLAVAWSGHGLVCAEFLPSPAVNEHARQLLACRLPRCQLVPGTLTAEAFFRAPLHLVGTPFQCRVWRALLALRRGETCHYQDLAEQLDSGARAVGSAVARNALALRVPCHRVVPRHGGSGQYRWGAARKAALLAAEAGANAG